MSNLRTKEIISFAKGLRKNWGSDPIKIAERFGLKIVFRPGNRLSAYTIKLDNYPTIISVSGCDDHVGRQVLCAHELGHALLHDSGVNRFEGTYRTIADDTEYEANLFAVALLFDENDFNISLSSMSNYVLKGILDYNLGFSSFT
ncbi:MAG: ImmA/IrrE family metallo-endopeptidase [Lachnospiraceae bacterium]|nr:ImmA/IrrE family metallo-endopeptidase [Lachnospiraceae bacterium]